MLEGVRVVELGVWVAGPAVGGLLADWGADVIKVEPPTGDPMRAVFGALGIDVGQNPPFELDNRGKRSVVIDLSTDEGRAMMERLLETADVFATNLRPDALERLGLDHVSVRARHRRLIYCSLTGYGLDGPDRDRAGYDVGAFWARSSAAAKLVPPGTDPPGIRSGFGDHTTALAALSGVLAALLDRQRTGEGRLVATSLLRAGTYVMGWDIGVYLRFGRIQGTRPRTEMAAPLINCYRAADGAWFWLLGLEQHRHWPGVVAALERPELATDPRFATTKARAEHAGELIAELDEAFATRPRSEWEARFDQHDVWWAPVQTIPEVTVDPQAHAAGSFVTMTPRSGEDPYSAVASPVSFSGYDQRPGPVPALGEHTEELRRELGLD
jgi:crotonobetainyl-CoA:carnitine CoA-transferase CaiB-like acyl-CoA transferase